MFRKSTCPTRGKKILCIAAVAAFSALCAPSCFTQSEAQQQNSDPLHQLWTATIVPNLHAKLRSTDQAEMLGATMMVPLHAAFQRRDQLWMRDFAAQFSQFASDPSALPSGEAAEISRLYYLYLASQFIVLAKQAGQETLIPSNLPDLLYSEVQTFWRVTPAWQWGRGPFPGGGRERLLWKLDHRKVEKSYYRAVLDHDLYVFGIAADLKAYGGSSAQQKAWKDVLEDVLNVAHRVFAQEVAYQPGGGWLFQPGVWTDHPEYAYAGNPEPRPGIKPEPVKGIGEDSSHSIRFPLWLTSLMQVYPPDDKEHRFYQDLRSGLEKQFYGKVLVQPAPDRPCFLITNFMDGSNGVYRWGYGSLGKENGYGPYQNSGSFLLGWWVFLDTDRMRKVYQDLAGQFPWARQCIDFYLGAHPPSAPRPESDYSPDQPQLRLYHLTVQLAASL